MDTYTYSYFYRDTRFKVLVPHRVWWRRLLGQKELAENKKWKRASVTLEDIPEDAAKSKWFHDALLKVSLTPDNKVHGRMLEEGEYETSYIPTRDSAVTREGDSLEQFDLGNSEVGYKFTSGKMKIVYQDGTQCMLLEPQRTNFILNSNLSDEQIKEIMNDLPNQYFDYDKQR